MKNEQLTYSDKSRRNTMRTVYGTLASLLLCFCLFSCESIIDADLHDAPSQLVIEGIVTNEDTTHTVLLSMSTPFTVNSTFIGVADAVVELTDETTQESQILTMTETGIYKTTKFASISGHSYFLRVNVNDKEYTARSVMPNHVPLTSIEQIDTLIVGIPITLLKSLMTDQAGEENFYKNRMFINGEDQKDISIGSDYRRDGLEISNLFLFNEDFAVGDTVDIHFLNIDRNVYNYFDSMHRTLNSNSAAPTNPISNITGGCLGYFSAQTIERTQTIIH